MVDFKSDKKIVIGLLIALILQVALLLWHLGLIDFLQSDTQKKQGQIAGTIENIENSLKRRPVDGLIWEESRQNETLNYYDSILTLSQSTASIKLNNGTQISLSENTLVTLEPPEKGRENEIRVQFTKGKLRARNPFDKTVLSNKTMTLTLGEKSEVNLGKVSDDNLSIEVLKGEVTLNQNGQSVNLSENEFLEVNGDVQNKLTLDQTLEWESKPAERIYTHQNKENVILKWTGQAERVEILGGESEKKKIDLNPGQTELTLTLELGAHEIFLISQNRRSPSLFTEIWQAPPLHLLRPQPRNRLLFGEHQFLWTALPDIKTYKVVLQGQTENLSFESAENSLLIQLNKEDDFKWSVWAEDEKGFVIPPLYQYPLFIRSNPFQAPQLNSPQIIEDPKKDKSSSFWMDILMPRAWAKNIKTAIFTWQNIEGADFYTVEISESTDFRELILQEKVQKSQFLWRNFDLDKKYYWRVAAGDLKGRMGLFSEPTLVQPALESDIKKWNLDPSNERIELSQKNSKKKIPHQSEPIPKTITSEIVKQKTTQSTLGDDINQKGSEIVETSSNKKEDELIQFLSWNGAQIWLQPGISQKSFLSEDKTKSQFEGGQLISLGLESQWQWSKTTTLNIIFQYTQETYKPKSSFDFPFQNNLNWQEWITRIFWHRSSNWGFGVNLFAQPQVLRKDLEIIGLEQRIGIGPSVIYRGDLENWSWHSDLSLSWVNQKWGVMTSHRILYNFYGPLQSGAELQYHYFDGTDTYQNLDIHWILGYRF